MTSPKVKKPVSTQHMNSWRMYRQSLDRSFPSKNILELVRSIGWVYSPGCSTPYLTLWARMSSFKVEELNKVVFDDRQLVQLETLRGCSMLVPRDQAAIALRIRSRTFTELSKQARQQMPVSEADMERIKTAVLKSLQNGPKTMEQLQHVMPSPLVRDFGPDLKRIGLTNSLTLSINLLKEDGKITKVHSKKRLDSTDYSYVLTSHLLPEVVTMDFRMEEACAKLAAQYFRSEGPARAKDFAWWAGINVTDAIKATGELKPKLAPVAVEGTKDEYLILETELDEFLAFTPDDGAINFIPYRDTFLKGQREIVDRFVPLEHSDKPFSRWKGKLINDPLATIVRGGQVIGVWEWNNNEEEVDMLLFDDDIPKSAERTLRKRSADLAEFIKSNLGEIRLQGLDYGPHQMTSIHDLKAFWGKGVHVDVRV